jgi:hypothetical protein
MDQPELQQHGDGRDDALMLKPEHYLFDAVRSLIWFS